MGGGWAAVARVMEGVRRCCVLLLSRVFFTYQNRLRLKGSQEAQNKGKTHPTQSIIDVCYVYV